jgi:hypothetical protein
MVPILTTAPTPRAIACQEHRRRCHESELRRDHESALCGHPARGDRKGFIGGETPEMLLARVHFRPFRDSVRIDSLRRSDESHQNPVALLAGGAQRASGKRTLVFAETNVNGLYRNPDGVAGRTAVGLIRVRKRADSSYAHLRNSQILYTPRELPRQTAGFATACAGITPGSVWYTIGGGVSG